MIGFARTKKEIKMENWDDRLRENSAAESSANATTLKAIKEAEEGKVTTFSSIDDFKKHMYDL